MLEEKGWEVVDIEEKDVHYHLEVLDALHVGRKFKWVQGQSFEPVEALYANYFNCRDGMIIANLNYLESGRDDKHLSRFSDVVSYSTRT